MNLLDKQKEEIHILRQEMYACAEKHQNNSLHPEVITASQRVDQALNAYDLLIRKRNLEINCMECMYRVDLQKTEFVKKAVQSALALNHNPQNVHNELIEIYWRLFNVTRDTLYFKLAFEHLSAYISAGYKPAQLSFNAEAVLEKAGYSSIHNYLHFIHYNHSKFYVKLTRHRINTIIGKGYAAKANSGITTNSIIEDIMEKISKREVGTYCYKVECRGEANLSYLIINEANDVYMQDNSGTQYKFIDFPPVENLQSRQ